MTKLTKVHRQINFVKFSPLLLLLFLHGTRSDKIAYTHNVTRQNFRGTNEDCAKNVNQKYFCLET